jgi:hypothetical protein
LTVAEFVPEFWNRMKKKTRNWLLVLCVLALPFLIFTGFLISDVLAPPLPPIPLLPNPNGYEDFVKAAQMLISIDEIKADGGYATTNQEQLQKLVSKNSEALLLARTGLSNECRVTTKFSKNYMDDDNHHMDELAGIKKLGLTFVAEGKLAEMENRPNAAAKSYLDAIHFSNESARGGLLLDQLVGTAIEYTGTDALKQIVNQLDAKSCRESAATLETLDAQRQTWDEVMQQEHAWSRRTFTGVRYEIARLMSRKSLENAFQKSEEHFQKQQLKARQLIIALATRAYELNKGKPPASLADLSPDYLKAVPQDPFTGTNMVYSPR